jgi:hypothetical protein
VHKRASIADLKRDPLLLAFARRMARHSLGSSSSSSSAKKDTPAMDEAVNLLFVDALTRLHSEGAIIETCSPPSFGDLIAKAWPGVGTVQKTRHEETYEVPTVHNLGAVLLEIINADPASKSLKGVDFDALVARLHKRAEWANVGRATVKIILAELDRQDRVESRVQGGWRLL